MKKIAIITSTRAEYGLLQPVINEFMKKETIDFQVELVVTGTHLSKRFGMTINEIQKNQVRIDEQIEVSVDSTNAYEISKNMSDVLLKFTALFEKKQYNAIMILGDRYEMLAVAIAAMNTKTPIFHLCGGDTTEGAIDECIRHSITKMSYLHFVTNEQSKKRVIQLGEHPDRVFNVGSTSVDNILNYPLLNKEEALKAIGLKKCDYVLCTYHPVTLEDINIEKQMEEFINVIRTFPHLEFIITKSNSDLGGDQINKLLDDYESSISNMHVYASLGITRYLSLMKACEFVLGNSSSGIIEAPILKVPTVNIGERQRGRLQCQSIVNCNADSESIKKAINKVSQEAFKDFCKRVESPYGEGHTAKEIVKISLKIINGHINIRKSFYDIKVGEK